MSEPKRVAIVLRSAGAHAAEGLRGAVGLAAYGLRVRVLLCEEAEPLLHSSGEASKAIATLRSLGHEILQGEAVRDGLPALLCECEGVEVWR